MVQAWIYNASDPASPRAPHKYTPNRAVPLSTLDSLGVQQWTREQTTSSPDFVDKIRSQRGYVNTDTVCLSREKLPDYDATLQKFFTVHMHEDEEIRYLLEGSGYFDVQAPRKEGEEDEEWIRIALTAGEMIILPAGMYHRFTLDENNFLRCMRLFKEDPKWTPLNRAPELEDNQYRRAYVETYLKPSSSVQAA
ncbi:1,2-dihydroxy-3-keto-5-methylthiopentene dioxygenase [Geranomyces variabilis]|uniref:Acireductone dioxygenase n=1 Tax=Geranomyces variabilis TaxID=109894 RepID=A0AAD5TCE2_9FUNG|nr:1,2-dihydroxy-3-keto-5-methylthiopentene dioxygenase [Geranomyces variabilis]